MIKEIMSLLEEKNNSSSNLHHNNCHNSTDNYTDKASIVVDPLRLCFIHSASFESGINLFHHRRRHHHYQHSLL